MTQVQKWLLLGSSILTGASGLVYWWMKHMLEPVSEWAVINHPLQPLMLKLHVLAAPLLVLAVGMVLSDHILLHYRAPQHPGRKSGGTAMWLLAPMILSGYLIQTTAAAELLRVLAWLHLISGVMYLAGAAVHFCVMQARRTRVAEGGKCGRPTRTWSTPVRPEAKTAPQAPRMRVSG